MNTLMEKEIFESPAAMEQALAQNGREMARIAAALRDRSSVFFAARGTSDHAAIYGKYLFETLLGMPAGLAAPSVVSVFGRQVDYSRSAVVGISQSGEAEDVRRVLESAKKSGAYTVAITNNAASPLALGADAHIDMCAGPEKSVAATKTFTCSLYVLAMLAAAAAGDDALTRALRHAPQTVEQALGLAGGIRALAPRYRFMDSCFTFARGYDYCMAFEAALKMQECAYIKAKAYSMSDFLHGPIAMIERDTPCFAYLSHGPFSEGMSDMLERLKRNGADITVFSDDDSLLSLADAGLPLPQAAHPALSPLSIAPAIQLFACQASLTRGLSPDTPRGLSKVTVTV
jgi:glucosamine--fructose-6-phosphate aminotransferase (isomerizing)